MCAIFGVGLLNGSKFTNNVAFGKLLEKLYLELEHRGRSATGLAFVSAKKIQVLKKDIRPSLFVASTSYQQAVRAYGDISENSGPIMVIGHCRQRTKGSEKQNVNNHPIVTKNIIGIHNGHIGNDDRLFQKYITSCDDFERAGQVDSEIIFRLLDYYINERGMNTKTAIIRTTRQLSGSYACAFVNRRNPYILWLFRDNNPTIIHLYTQTGLILFASTHLAISNAARVAGIKEEPVNFYMQQQEGLGMNFFTNKLTRIPLVDRNLANIDINKNAMHDMSG